MELWCLFGLSKRIELGLVVSCCFRLNSMHCSNPGKCLNSHRSQKYKVFAVKKDKNKELLLTGWLPNFCWAKPDLQSPPRQVQAKPSTSPHQLQFCEPCKHISLWTHGTWVRSGSTESPVGQTWTSLTRLLISPWRFKPNSMRVFT